MIYRKMFVIFLLISQVIVANSYSESFCSIEFRRVVDAHEKEIAKKAERFSYIDKYGKSESVYVENAPEIIIPPNLVKDVEFSVIEFAKNEYLKTVDNPLQLMFDSSIRNDLTNVIEKNIEKQVAIFVCNKVIEIPIVRDLPEGLKGKGSAGIALPHDTTIDHQIALIMNLGITPKYKDIYVKTGKPEYKKVVKHYKIRPPFNETKGIYPAILNESEYWVTREEVEVFSENHQSKKLPKRFMVKQFFSPYLSKWRQEKEMIMIENPYGGGAAWINKNKILPFFSILNTDIFLGTFFINNELKWQLINDEKNYYMYNYTYAKWKEIESIRKLYIKEARERFINEEEFKKWYLDNFDKPFVED